MLYKVLKFILKPFIKLFMLYRVTNLPKNLENKNYIICANHKNMFDPIMLGITFDKQIYFMSKKEAFNNKLLGFLISKLGAFPVDRGGNDMSAIRASMKVLNEGKVLGIFPEGTRIRDEISSRDKFNDGIAMIATKTNSDIIPVRITGKYKLFGGLKIIYKDVIKIESYKDLPKREQYTKLVDDVYTSIYENHK